MRTLVVSVFTAWLLPPSAVTSLQLHMSSLLPKAAADSRRGFLAAGALVGLALPARADLPQGRSVPLDQRERQRGPQGVRCI